MTTYTKTTVDLNTDNLERFREIYRMKGSIKWFMNACLEKFVSAHNIGVLTPDSIVDVCVSEVLEMEPQEEEEES